MSTVSREMIKNTMKESFLILLFEFIGTIALSCLVNNYYSEAL